MISVEYVWEGQNTKEKITKHDVVEQLKKATKEKDESGIRLLKLMLIDMKASDEYPEYFL